MKLRNKKTGEIKDLECITVFVQPGKIDISKAEDEFYTIAELDEEWEDYEPKEPLIEDKDIRKAVRAFGEVYKGEPLRFNRWGRSFEIYDVSGNIGGSICFNTTELGLTNGKEYTIDELCGEEEE